MSSPTKREALLRHIDQLIDTHGNCNPELISELRKLRIEADDAMRRSQWREYADVALRVVTIVKFLWDHLPPPH